MILWEHVEGTAWAVAHDPGTGVIVPTPAAPEWASPELAAAWEGWLLAAVAGSCPECGAVRPPQKAPVSAAPVPHAAACRLSPESAARMEAACRPPGKRWIADVREETTDAVAAYCGDLAASLTAAGQDGPRRLPQRAGHYLR